jgi:hypothetical protein
MSGNALITLSRGVEPVVLFAPRNDGSDFRKRVHLSSGTCLAATVDSGVPLYVEGARAPIPEWRVPTSAENLHLWPAAPPATYRGVGLVQLLSPQLLRLYQGRADIFARGADAETLQHPLVALLLDIIARAGLIAAYVLSARLGHDEPGRITMTKAVDQDARIGLHFDRWDRCPIEELGGSTNRVSINLGPTDRYFIFLNHTARGMLAILQNVGVAVERDVGAIGKRFMSTFPDYPVARVRLRPGDAYIAPTENILHDASSAETANVNHYLSVRGRFDFAGA